MLAPTAGLSLKNLPAAMLTHSRRQAWLSRFAPDARACAAIQIVVATLMNICDNPTRVSIAQGWRENDVIQRIPIIVTGMLRSEVSCMQTGANKVAHRD